MVREQWRNKRTVSITGPQVLRKEEPGFLGRVKLCCDFLVPQRLSKGLGEVQAQSFLSIRVVRGPPPHQHNESVGKALLLLSTVPALSSALPSEAREFWAGPTFLC